MTATSPAAVRLDGPPASAPVAVIGAGVMGVGIVQIAALAGHPVKLHDTREGAAAGALERLGRTLRELVSKGRLETGAVEAALARIEPVSSVDALAGSALVIEAIVEVLDVKQGLLRDLEAVVADDCVLASNTSSLSITALARGLRLPGRVVGMHFFNPVPVMKLVEVVSGLATEPAVADAIHALSKRWGKTPVHAKSTPGFIVNRIARPYYAETLALLQEQAATPAQLDACLRGAGFRMGPCELMDLIGQDTNFSVTRAVHEANFFDNRFVPSLVQRDLVDGGRLGRKSGRGFYRYDLDGPDPAAALPAHAGTPALPEGAVALHGEGPLVDALAARFDAVGRTMTRVPASSWGGIACGAGSLVLSDGRCAAEIAAAGVDDANAPRTPVAVIDWPIDSRASLDGTTPLAYALADAGDATFDAAVAGLLHALGWRPVRVADVAGLPVARTIAMLVNEASDAVVQGVCDEAGADAAMKLGVNYPAGPFEWLARCGAPAAVRLLDALDAHYRGERYRVSPGLRRRSWSPATAR
jgi:3-hydroxybutyryl-CoA dehydrogenase